MRRTITLILILLVAFVVTNCKLDVDNENYAGTKSYQGYIYDAKTNAALTPTSMTITIGDKVFKAKITNNFYLFSGIPENISTGILDIALTDAAGVATYFPVNKSVTFNTGIKNEDHYLVRNESLAASTITISINDVFGSPLGAGTVKVVYDDTMAIPEDKKVYTYTLDGTSTEHAVVNTLYPGKYDILIVNAKDHNGIKFIPEKKYNDVQIDSLNTFIMLTIGTVGGTDYPQHPDGATIASKVIVTEATNVALSTTDANSCTQSAVSPSIKFTFKKPILLNYFSEGVTPNISSTNLSGAPNYYCYTATDGTGTPVNLTNNQYDDIAIAESSTIFTTGSSTLTLTLSSDAQTVLATINGYCVITSLSSFDLRFAEYAGSTFNLSNIFLESAAGRLYDPGCNDSMTNWRVK